MQALAERFCGIHITARWQHPEPGLPNTSAYELQSGIGGLHPNVVKIEPLAETQPHQVYAQFFCASPEVDAFIPVRVWDALITVGAPTPPQPWALTLQQVSSLTPHAAASPRPGETAPPLPPPPPVTSAAPATPASTSPWTPPPPAPSPATGRTLVVHGLDGHTYRLDILALDHITDCAAHAYGTPVRRFLHRHPCTDAHRLLATATVDGRRAALSIITVSFAATRADKYGYEAAQQFVHLENAPGTGSLNDLLREHHPIPGIATAIPAHEAFYVTGEDRGDAIFDTWWTDGTTRDQDPILIRFEKALFLTPATQFG